MLKLDPEKYRVDFPITSKYTYLDSACVSLKPRQVVEKMNEYYLEYSSCGGRSSHSLGRRVTQEVSLARKSIEKFFGGKVIFLRNTTEGINLVAKSLDLKKKDVILISDKEHNSNLVVWQELAKKGVVLRFFKHGNLDDFKEKVKGVKVAATNHVSNLDGSSQDIYSYAKACKKEGSLILIDGAQGLPHKKVDVTKFDFYVASGHKMLGPSGTGLLFVKDFESLNNFNVGGDTVRDTFYEKSEFEKGAKRFEAGLQDYAGIIGLEKAADYLKKVRLSKIEKHEKKLKQIAREEIKEIEELQGDTGILSFNLPKVNPKDVALQLDSENILVRAGYHCCHSWFNANKVKGSVRASFYFYNTQEEALKFANKVNQIHRMLR